MTLRELMNYLENHEGVETPVFEQDTKRSVLVGTPQGMLHVARAEVLDDGSLLLVVE